MSTALIFLTEYYLPSSETPTACASGTVVGTRKTGKYSTVIRQSTLLNQSAELFFSFYQRTLSQVSPIQIQQIECVENWASATKKQLIENAPAFRIPADKLSVDDGVLHP